MTYSLPVIALERRQCRKRGPLRLTKAEGLRHLRSRRRRMRSCGFADALALLGLAASLARRGQARRRERVLDWSGRRPARQPANARAAGDLLRPHQVALAKGFASASTG